MTMMLSYTGVMSQRSMPIAKIDSKTSRKGEIVWVDLVTHNGKASKKFFKDLLGWSFKDDAAYSLAMSGSKPVAGIIEDKELLEGAKVSYWVLSTAVDDVQETTKKITASGGKVLSEPAEVQERGTVALVEDAQGAFFALLHNRSGDPKASAPEEGEWMWAELWTKDPKAAVSFYSDVLPITTRSLFNTGAETYFVLKGATYESSGITEIPVKNESPIWIPVLRVANSKATASKAVEMGGAILMGPVELSGNKVALIATPTGAPFLVQEWRQ